MPAANLPNQVIPLVASAARTTSGNTGNLKDTTANLPECDTMAIYVNVTVINVTELTVYIETSVDGGTTWVAAAAFTPIASIGAGGGSATRRLDFHGGIFVGEAATEQSASYSIGGVAAASALKGNTPLTRDVRVCWDIVGTTATFSVWAICVPYGKRG
jgi:hypothetical protein